MYRIGRIGHDIAHGYQRNETKTLVILLTRQSFDMFLVRNFPRISYLFHDTNLSLSVMTRYIGSLKF